MRYSHDFKVENSSEALPEQFHLDIPVDITPGASITEQSDGTIDIYDQEQGTFAALGSSAMSAEWFDAA